MGNPSSPDMSQTNAVSCPERGMGILPPLHIVEAGYNWIVTRLPALSAVMVLVIAFCISVDVAGRLFFNRPWRGITEMETLFMSAVAFLAMPCVIVRRESMQVDLFFNFFPEKMQRCIYLFANLLCTAIAAVLGWRAFLEGWGWVRRTISLGVPEGPSIMLTGICMAIASVAFFFQVCHILKVQIRKREFLSIIISIALFLLICYLPWLYKSSSLQLTTLNIGLLSFGLLLILLLVRIPLGWAMGAIGVLGLLTITRRPEVALKTVATIPYFQTSTFIMIALPMFMLMGEMITLSGLSHEIFDAAKKWFGRLPGGLAVATIGGCAGFGAVCGDSLAVCITMNAVAFPPMRESGYNEYLGAGALAAGGTLGILIPPSMGFIIYSMITEASVGKLFVAGIIPGIILATLFMGIIIVQVLINPSLAPKIEAYPLSQKLWSLTKLGPVVALFMIVVFGILWGWFTPGEGGAVGALLGFLYALARRKITWQKFKKAMMNTTIMFGKIFALFVGVYVLSSFMAASRVPQLLANAIVGMDISPGMVLAAIMAMYIVLGLVINIIPLMLLTLPPIYPTVVALGFDPIWFGVLCVIVMEMGQITPPVGINVFVMSGLQPHLSMVGIFKGVMPFFIGMMICLLLIIFFPQLALFIGGGA